MNTIILMWNPQISSLSIDDYLEGMKYFEEFNLNWSVFDFKNVHKGDRFYMVRVGNGNTGIVMSGQIFSSPHLDEHWDDDQKTAFYVDLDIEYMFHPDKGPILDTEFLSEVIPDFNWAGGHSGQVLTTTQAATLEKLWQAHIKRNASVLTNTQLVIHADTPCLDYVKYGISQRARQNIEGVEHLDTFYSQNSDDTNQATIVDFHYNDRNYYIDFIIRPVNGDHLLQFHFTNILDLRWDNALFITNIRSSRIYSEYSYIVAEFDGTRLQISADSLTITPLDPEKYDN